MKTSPQKALDKTGREIEPGDVLKAFHFIGARRKRHFMYKQAIEYIDHPGGGRFLKVSHLNRIADEPWEIGKNYFLETADGYPISYYEIVQSVDAEFEKRPRA